VELRYTLAVVTGAGRGLGHEVAIALSRRGASVLAVDADPAAAEATAAQVREARVKAWSFQADPAADEVDVRLVAARARDLGGADLLVDTVGSPALLEELFTDDLAHRRGVRRHPGAAVRAGADARCREVLDALADPPPTRHQPREP
jgi:NAD(P)-dependent dehydrogenase (short-subunit alcohol dehydrogenase family)